MSVPLDRFYNFLYDIMQHDDIVIYGFSPFGSRKLEDLQVWFGGKSYTWFQRMTTPRLIFHDQEPLMYNLYDYNQIYKHVDVYGGYFPSENSKKLVSTMHLRACIDSPMSVYDQVLLCHSEQNSADLELYQRHGFIGVYFWSHAMIARDWFRFAELDPNLRTNFDSINYDFLIFNRAWSGSREYRLTLAEMLANDHMIQHCKITFSPFDNDVYYTQHRFNNANLATCRDDLHKLYDPNTHDSNASADYNAADYACSAIEVVLETLFDDCRHHLTEKTLRPIACGRPFILASTPGSLQYLKQYGFTTFSGLIDETYDTILNPRQRLQAIVKEMKRISSLSPAEKQQLWRGVYDIAQQNQKLFFSVEWQHRIVQEFENNFDLAVSKLTATGVYQNMAEQIAQTDPDLARCRSSDSLIPGGPTLADRLAIKQWISERHRST